jgi:hypothetical protein
MRQVLHGIFLVVVLGILITINAGSKQITQKPLRFPEFPSATVLEIISMGNKTLMSSLMFFHAEFYFGEKTGWRNEPPEYQRLFKALDKATDLDPYSMDCYYFAQGILSGIKPAIPPLNRLLEKGLKYRKDDWYLPFFISANYYFQLNDPVAAAQYLKLAAKLKPETPLFATLTARMLYQGNKTEAAISYLEALVEETKNASVRKALLRRLKALAAIRYLEKAVEEYTHRKGNAPESLNALVQDGLIKKMPEDPYGGTFHIAKDGRIITTSNLADAWKKNGKKRDNSEKFE